MLVLLYAISIKIEEEKNRIKKIKHFHIHILFSLIFNS